jgi:hypothetical protein
MITFVKKVFEKLFRTFPNHADDLIVKEWEAAGKPSPPPHQVKRRVILKAGKHNGYKILIETGTYMGEMVNAQKDHFKKIYSIELGDDLYANAVENFKNYPHISILHGDSGQVLKDLMPLINEPAIFWLDGHYSAGITAKGAKECPIYEELTAIFNGKPLAHILLIDDARLFVGQNDYPTTDELTREIKSKRPQAEVYCDWDIIHVFL